MPDTIISVGRLLARPRHLFGPTREMTRAVGFWLAIVLPLAYLPLVVVAPAVIADPLVLGSAVVGNLLALVVGHDHEPSVARFTRRN